MLILTRVHVHEKKVGWTVHVLEFFFVIFLWQVLHFLEAPPLNS